MNPTPMASQGMMPMTMAPSEGVDCNGILSLEVRWILPGRLGRSVTAWFERLQVERVALQDVYLLEPYLPGLSVKVREERALEVKMYRGSPGLLELPGRARGRLESWQKWSFPHGPPSGDTGDRAGWALVGKRRRIGWFAQPSESGMTELGEEPACAVELTAIELEGEPWWTLGFEATGPADLLRRELDAAAARVFAEALPDGVELDIGDSQSYVQWLGERVGAAAG